MQKSICIKMKYYLVSKDWVCWVAFERQLVELRCLQGLLHTDVLCFPQQHWIHTQVLAYSGYTRAFLSWPWGTVECLLETHRTRNILQIGSNIAQSTWWSYINLPLQWLVLGEDHWHLIRFRHKNNMDRFWKWLGMPAFKWDMGVDVSYMCNGIGMEKYCRCWKLISHIF